MHRDPAIRPIVNVTVEADELDEGEYDARLIVKKAGKLPTSDRAPELEPLGAHLDRARREHVVAVVRACGGSRKDAAKALGVDVRTVFRILGVQRRSRR